MPLNITITDPESAFSFVAETGDTVLNFTVSDGVGPAGPPGADYTLPTASDTVLGGIKVGSGLTITAGVLSVSGSSYTLPIATDSTLGGVISGGDVSVDSGTGEMTVSTSTTSSANSIVRRGANGEAEFGSDSSGVAGLVGKSGDGQGVSGQSGSGRGGSFFSDSGRGGSFSSGSGTGLYAETSSGDYHAEFGFGYPSGGAKSFIARILGSFGWWRRNAANNADFNGRLHAPSTLEENCIWTLPPQSGALATEAYADALVVGMLDDRGNYDASGNVFPSSGGSGTAGAVLKGDLWTISVAGTLGGTAVTAGDVLRALIDTPGQTAANWVVTENNLGYVPQNTAGTLSLGGFSSITGTIAISNIGGLGTGVATALAVNLGSTGALARLSDITGTNSGTNTGDETLASIQSKLGIQVKKSTAQMDVTSSATFVDIPGLTGYSLEADTVYRVEFFGSVTAGASGGYKVAINSTSAFFHTTSGTQGVGSYWQTVGNASLPFQIDSTNIQINARTGASTALPMSSIIYIRTNAATTVKFQGAQNVSNGTTTSFLAGQVASIQKLI